MRVVRVRRPKPSPRRWCDDGEGWSTACGGSAAGRDGHAALSDHSSASMGVVVVFEVASFTCSGSACDGSQSAASGAADVLGDGNGTPERIACGLTGRTIDGRGGRTHGAAVATGQQAAQHGDTERPTDLADRVVHGRSRHRLWMAAANQ